MFCSRSLPSCAGRSVCIAAVALLLCQSPALSQDRSQDDSHKALFADLSDPYGLRISANDPRLEAIEQLTQNGSPPAVKVLETYLTTYGASRKLKQRTLVALGKIGTKEAVEAIQKFEAWAEQIRRDPPAFRFGKRDHGIDHFAQYELKPLAQATDPQGTEWAVFRWSRYGWRQPDLWITHRKDEQTWSLPSLIASADLPIVKADEEMDLAAEKDAFTLSVNGKSFRFTLDQLHRDSDEDGLPDAVEKILATDPAKKDTDGDGVHDRADGNPLTPKSPQKDDVAQIRQAVFTALFATCNGADTLVMVERGDFAKQEYAGYGGIVLRAADIRQGFANITDIKVTLESPNTAAATISDWEGNLAASSHLAKLRKKHGKWVVVEFKLGRIS